MEEEDARREAAMAATELFQPNFQSSSISHTQLYKLKELRKRRLQIKKNTSSFKKMKGKTNGDRTNMVGEVGGKKDINQTDCQQSVVLEEAFPCAKNEHGNTKCMKQNALLPWKKQQKLHWGLDTKERWERKGNM
ncbi:uncharacterized protein LOC131071338 [Cryptomeria japonica]|uniref:uncharacterized protein LOC131071338 n=1 Tax=Cryptomeria japonica TaxID=3369 RepID=UPI0027DA6845|nr:uncharacterized protein LOC131071338 [Cryptomeria japonica]